MSRRDLNINLNIDKKKPWKIFKNPPVSLAGVSKGVSNISMAMKDTVTGATYEVPDTSSPLMDSKIKELDQSASYILAILKGMKKQQKCLKSYYEASDYLTEALLAYSRSGFISDDLSATLDIIREIECFRRQIMVDLATHNGRLQEQMKGWIDENVPPARAEKKQFDNQRRILDESYLKVARIAAEEKKGGEKAKQKLKESITERGHAEEEYKKQGDKSYFKILDTVENMKYFYLEQLNVLFSGYEVHFQQGLDNVTSYAVKMQDIKEKAGKEQQHFKMQALSRPKGLWAPEFIGGDNKRRVFAMNYQQIVDRDKPPGDILIFLDQCFNLLEQYGLTTVGLFRVSAPKPALDAIRDKIDRGQPLPVEELIDEIHMVSGLIKLFLRELPIPLLTFDLYSEWMGIVDFPKEERPLKIKDLVLRLPLANRVLLERLVFLCTKILEFTSENKMTAENLAIVLCPSILYDKDPNPLTMVADIQKANSIMINMCQNYKIIFEGIAQPRPQNMIIPNNPMPVQSSVNNFPIPNTPPPQLPAPPPPGNTSQPSIPLLVNPSQSISSKLDRESSKRAPSSVHKMALGGSRTKLTNNLTNAPSGTTTTTGTTTTGITTTPGIATTPGTTTTPGIATTPGTTPSQPVLQRIPSGSEKNFIIKSVPDNMDTVDGPPVEDDMEEKRGNQVYITLNPPPLSLVQLYKLLENRESTFSYYQRLYELFDGTYMFTRAAHSMKDFTMEELNLLNNAFQAVGKAIKNMLLFIKEYTSKFPPEIGKRLVVCANKVRPHIKSLISFIKSYNSGQKLEPAGLVQATRAFLLGTYQMYLTCHRASQMDELSQSGLKCKSLLKSLLDTLKENKQAEGSVLLNNLQNYILKFTSLLRSRLPDMSDTNLQEQLSMIVENAEQHIGDIFDAARDMLESGDLHVTPQMESALDLLNTSINKALGLRINIEEAITADMDVSRMIDVLVEQIESISETHQESENQTIRDMLSHLNAIIPEMINIRSNYATAPDTPKQWLDTCAKVISELDYIKDIVDTLIPKIPDESLHDVMTGYSSTTEHFVIQFKIGVAAAAFGIKVNGFEVYSFVTPVKDFTFVTYPFMYNLQEATTLVDGTNV